MTKPGEESIARSDEAETFVARRVPHFSAGELEIRPMYVISGDIIIQRYPIFGYE